MQEQTSVLALVLLASISTRLWRKTAIKIPTYAGSALNCGTYAPPIFKTFYHWDCGDVSSNRCSTDIPVRECLTASARHASRIRRKPWYRRKRLP